MRVEAPTTFMTAHQQSKDNQRRDKLDDQQLAFSIFNEKRARAKHEYQMDMGEENVRHAKTMNPLMESLRLHENELKWGTLESDIGFAEERTRHAKTMNPLQEHFQRYKNKLAWDTVDSSIRRHKRKTEWDDTRYNLEEGRLESNLDNQKWKFMQHKNYKGTSFDAEENAEMKRLWDKKNEVLSRAMEETTTEQKIQANIDALDLDMSGRVRSQGESRWKNEGDDIALAVLNNKYSSPAYMQQRNYDLDRYEYPIRRKGQQLEMDSILAGEESLKKQRYYQEQMLELYKLSDKYYRAGEDEKEADVWKRIEMMTGSGLMQGANMNQYLQKGQK